ncbi:MAG: hypothetical protein ACR2MG_18630 [Pyrinomonadaceae bacterium]
MDYFILKDEETGEIEKIGRYGDNGIAEKLQFGEWVRDRVLDRQMFDGLLEQISEVRAKEIIAQMLTQEKIAA